MENDVIKLLENKLKELEWKLNSLGEGFNPNRLPKGLFHITATTGSAKACIDNIQTDITHLSTEISSSCGHYLANKIQQKINVLVQYYQAYNATLKSVSPTQTSFAIDAMKSRQSWLNELEAQMASLSLQQSALKSHLAQLEMKGDAACVLEMKKELGVLEQQLSLLQEQLQRIV